MVILRIKVLEDVLCNVSEVFDSCGLEKDLSEGRSTKEKIMKSIKTLCLTDAMFKKGLIPCLVAAGRKSYHL